MELADSVTDSSSTDAVLPCSRECRCGEEDKNEDVRHVEVDAKFLAVTVVRIEYQVNQRQLDRNSITFSGPHICQT